MNLLTLKIFAKQRYIQIFSILIYIFAPILQKYAICIQNANL